MKASVALLLFVTAFQQTVAWGVFSFYFEYDGSYYDVSALRTDWYTARSICRLHESELMSFDDSGMEVGFINNMLGDLANNGEDIWTGGTNFISNGYYWDQSGRIFGEGPMNWAPGLPNSGREFSCVAMSADFNQGWVDAECNKKKLFVCESKRIKPCPNREEDLIKQREILNIPRKSL